MVAQFSTELVELVDQLTLRKLVYVRELLRSLSQPYSGTRARIRDQLLAGITSGLIETAKLQRLLDELDAWGDQRIRVARFPLERLVEYQSAEAIARKAAGAGMSQLLDGPIALNPPTETTPMRISYQESDGGQFLTIIAAKTRQVMQPQVDIPDHYDDQYPGVVFKPYKLENKKAIDFAEINLQTGYALISTTLIQKGIRYSAEFDEFYSVFSNFIMLRDSEPIPLYNANLRLREFPPHEIRLVGRRSRTASGGRVDYRSHSLRADMRTDAELDRAYNALPDAPGLFANCYWERGNGLNEPVHTYIFAPTGEVSIVGQVLEVSARYVLRRILEIN